jgi:hypothetical protein
MRVGIAVAVIGGCYAPDPAAGSPCDDGHPCPPQLFCSVTSHRCQRSPGELVDAAAGRDGVASGDASPAGDGISAMIDAPTCPGGMACERYVFATSSAYTASLGGPDGADTRCQALADAAPPPIQGRSFRAWLGSAAMSASARHVHGTMPYRSPSGAVIANDWTDLTDGTLQRQISTTELGGTTSGSVWTATTTAGDQIASSCDDWTTTGGTGGAFGDAGKADASWTQSGGVKGCATSLPLYCFER